MRQMSHSFVQLPVSKGVSHASRSWDGKEPDHTCEFWCNIKQNIFKGLVIRGEGKLFYTSLSFFPVLSHHLLLKSLMLIWASCAAKQWYWVRRASSHLEPLAALDRFHVSFFHFISFQNIPHRRSAFSTIDIYMLHYTQVPHFRLEQAVPYEMRNDAKKKKKFGRAGLGAGWFCAKTKISETSRARLV